MGICCSAPPQVGSALGNRLKFIFVAFTCQEDRHRLHGCQIWMAPLAPLPARSTTTPAPSCLVCSLSHAAYSAASWVLDPMRASAPLRCSSSTVLHACSSDNVTFHSSGFEALCHSESLKSKLAAPGGRSHAAVACRRKCSPGVTVRSSAGAAWHAGSSRLAHPARWGRELRAGGAAYCCHPWLPSSARCPT